MTATLAPSSAAVVALDIERLVHIDQRIDATEGDGLRARWDFGHQMLAARDGAGRLPNGYLATLVERTGKSRAELKFRARFATVYPTELELAIAVANCHSWNDVRASLKVELDAEDNTPAGPPVIPEGTFGTIVADPPWRYGWVMAVMLISLMVVSLLWFTGRSAPRGSRAGAVPRQVDNGARRPGRPRAPHNLRP